LKKIDSLTIPLNISKNSLNTILSKCARSSFYLNINTAATSSPIIGDFVGNNYLSRLQEFDPSKNNGYGFKEFYRKSAPLNQKYNALIFIKYTQGANPMK